ncbi:AraC family transcriptional regulator [Haliangium ochraceum]|uniref:Transcriptional regulator, AraC family n=1 Tax=Haliangium ochraceum (strain DSM 14365 / JCM 11303 / SMP-2) TaxID=502025 RepID=D0LYU6_HALO1|nr:AraC family transcriptional regulator [Haliangium ochraceum]ACY14416.1 transcriptional regulator, AraC family [Haliangium ochraceum DSM 14365]
MSNKPAHSSSHSLGSGGASAGATMWARGGAQMAAFALRLGVPRPALVDALGAAAAAALLPEPGAAGAAEDLDARVSVDAVYALLEAAVQATGDEALGLHFAQHIEVGDLDALGFLMVTSPTMGDAFTRFIRYQRVWNEGERYELHERGELAHLVFTPYGPPRPAHRQMAEMAFYDVAINGGRLVEQGLDLRHLRFRHHEPAETGHYRELFGLAPSFSAPVDEIVLTRASLAQPLPDANAAMCAFFARHAQARLDALGPAPGVVEQVRDIVGTALPEGPLALEAVAERLRMSARTLQRRLRAENTSLHRVLEQLRRERALSFLGTPMAIGEIAYLLGYSEPSAFHRAFKRWTGTTPEAFRVAP